MAEQLPEAGCQGIEVDIFDRHTHGGIPILATSTRCLPDVPPIGGPITGTLEAATLDKGFYQVEGMAVFVLPIRADSFQDDG
jgi:hypothetical protein